MTIKLCLYEVGVITLLSESVSGSQCHNTGIQGYQTPMGLKFRVNGGRILLVFLDKTI